MKRTDDLAQLKRLVMFAYVVEQGSFAKAAEMLDMNRSGVSEQIGMLEQYLNVRLLHRTTRSLSLTSDGEVILPQAQLIAQTMRSIRSSLSEDLLNGRIRISTTNDIAICWLNKKIKQFQENYSGIAFDLKILESQDPVVEEELDLSFYMGDMPDMDSLVVKPIVREKTQIFASPKLLSDLPKINSVEKLNNVNWILEKDLEESNKCTIYKKNSDISSTIQPALFDRVNSKIVMIEQVKVGLGFGLLLPSMVQTEIEKGELVKVLPSWQGEEVIFSSIYSAYRTMPRRVKMFLDFLSEA